MQRSRTETQGSTTADELHARLDVPLPHELWTAGETAVFVCGWCFHTRRRIRRLTIVADGDRQPVMAHGMPRLDPLRDLHPDLDPAARSDPGSAEDPWLHSYASGFWGLVRVRPREAGGPAIALVLSAELDDGRLAEAALGSIAIAARPAERAGLPWTAIGGVGPLVAICMATYNPPPALLNRQLESIRQQTHQNWLCLISDDASRPEAFSELQRAVAGDPRFVVSRSPRRRGFYLNFERALAMVPSEAQYVALADQDDYWRRDKLARLLAGIGSSQLVYSDARVVTADGRLISDTYWTRRRNNHTDLLSLLVANSVTGAASLLRRELLDDALPFPPGQFAHYHDHWLALVALTLGGLEFVEEPLYDYVQHDTATLGHDAANRMPSLGERLRTQRNGHRDKVRMWRMHYFVDACRLLQLATILQLRGGSRIPADRRQVLDQFLSAESSPTALPTLGLRGMRELLGRHETLGGEWMLFRAFSWRRLVSLTARSRPQRRLRLDAVPPPDLAPRPGQQSPDLPPAVRSIEAKIATLPVKLTQAEPVRLNMLIPTIDLAHFFGGYIGKFNLARRLSEVGQRVRIVTVDPVPPLPRDWRRTIESYKGLAGFFDRVEVAFGRERTELEVNPADRFIATTWWTAHIAANACRILGGGRFLYLIQEYEPFTFAHGTYAALATESYQFPHLALFSSELLREYFRRHAIGVFASDAAGRANSWSFQNAITDVEAPTPDQLASRTGARKLLFYARPEPHAARNLFELGLLALVRAHETGAFPGHWQLNGIGTVELAKRIPLGAGIGLDLLPRADQASYASLLRDHDVGLALMYTPHPSLVPIEMASAGLLTVTNTFENKTSSALADISANLFAAEPTVEAIAGALGAAAAEVDDVERRLHGSSVGWSRDWDQSLDDELIRRLLTALAGQ